MKTSTLLLIFFAVLCIFTTQIEARQQLDLASDSDDEAIEEAGIIEINPDYVEPEVVVDEEYDDDDENENEDIYDAVDSDWSDDETDEEAEEAKSVNVKTAIDGILGSKTKTIKTLLKSRARVILILALIAFRKEILQASLYILKKKVLDPETGKPRLSPTQILKLALFIDLMRRIQKQSGSEDSPIQSLAAILGESNPLIGAVLSKFVRSPNHNPAYVPPINQNYAFERFNEKYLKDGLALHKAIHSRPEGFQWPGSDSKKSKVESANMKDLELNKSNNQTVILLDFTKLGATPSEQVRDQVSFLLSQYRHAALLEPSEDSNTAPELEIVLILESPGGSAVDFGLAAQQLLRLRKQEGITLTICVDRIAASGGYMLACTASPGQLFAAPFSVVGSIGVLGQIININQLLEGFGVTPIVFRGGKDKAPLGLIGEVTRSAKEKTQSMIEDTHTAFKDHVITSRPVVEKYIQQIGTGDVWLGTNALDLALVDGITTSDEYIGQKVADGARVLKMVKWSPKKGFLLGRQADAIAGFSGGNMLRNLLSQAKSLIGLQLDSSAAIPQHDLELESEKIPLVATRVQVPKAHI